MDAGRADDVDRLYRRFYRLVRYRAYDRLGSLDDAEDVAQDVFVRVLQADVDLGDLRDPWAWLAEILRTVLLDARRAREARKRGRGVAPISIEGLRPEPGYDPHLDSLVIAREATKHMLGALRPKARPIFAATVLDGRECKDVARRLSVSAAYVEAHKRRSRPLACAALRQYFGRDTGTGTRREGR